MLCSNSSLENNDRKKKQHKIGFFANIFMSGGWMQRTNYNAAQVLHSLVWIFSKIDEERGMLIDEAYIVVYMSH